MNPNTNAMNNVTFSVILACPESFSRQERFRTSRNDNTKQLCQLNAFVLIFINPYEF